MLYIEYHVRVKHKLQKARAIKEQNGKWFVSRKSKHLYNVPDVTINLTQTSEKINFLY